ncbi:DUF2863 family protein [Massilia sp. W12]|uniref:DUF2863 family protein n=1 Tax=Massilia sp. W12 TaxID=3126507 RepID=UPI0030CAC2F5
MRRPNKDSQARLSAESLRLVGSAQAVVQAASRYEERYLERSLDGLLQKVLKGNHQEQIDAALNHLFSNDLAAYDALMEAVEANSESMQLELEENGVAVKYDCILVVAPILAWTRFSIASGAIPADLLATLSMHLQAHMLADGAKLALSPNLYSIDQMPRSHGEAYTLTQRLAQAALKSSTLSPSKKLPEAAPFLADTRYLIAAVAVPHGQPFFRWQMAQHQANFAEVKKIALEAWREQALPNLGRMLPGCGLELLLPEAYYIACREADKAIRPVSVRAAVHFITHTLGRPPEDFCAAIAGFGEEMSEGQVDEYRISFLIKDEPQVVYGVVWPIYGMDEEDAANQGLSPSGARRATVDVICNLLQEAGVTDIKRYSERFAPEYCDDCGTPLFVDLDADLAHPEMPDDTPAGGAHLH